MSRHDDSLYKSSYENSQEIDEGALITLFAWLGRVQQTVQLQTYPAWLPDPEQKQLSRTVLRCTEEMFMTVMRDLHYRMALRKVKCLGLSCLLIANAQIAGYDYQRPWPGRRFFSRLTAGDCSKHLLKKMEIDILHRTNHLTCPEVAGLNNFTKAEPYSPVHRRLPQPVEPVSAPLSSILSYVWQSIIGRPKTSKPQTFC